MKVNRTEVLKALQVVKPGLANLEIIEQSSSFAFLGNRVVTYNDVISVSHPITGLKLKGAIRADELYGFLKHAKSEEVLLKFTENEILFKSGRSKAGIRLQQKITLPLAEIEAEKDWVDLPEEFVDNLMFVKDSCSSDMGRRMLTCVHCTENLMESSDGFAIMRLYDAKWPFENTLIPAEVIPEIKKINPIQMALSESWLHFKNADGTELSCRVLEDAYPSTTEHFEMEGASVVFPEKMNEVLERASVFAKKEHEMEEELEILLNGDDTLLVHGQNSYGWFKEKTSVEYEGDPVRFSIHPDLLRNILDRSNTCNLGTEKIMFNGEGWEYLAVLKASKKEA